MTGNIALVLVIVVILLLLFLAWLRHGIGSGY